MKCQCLFSGKNKKNKINLSSAEFAKSGKGFGDLITVELQWLEPFGTMKICSRQQ